MKILFDQGTAVPLRRFLPDHAIDTVYEVGWSTLQNGVLLQAAEQEGYELFITTDQNLRYQQNLWQRRLAIIVRLSTEWRRIHLRIDDTRNAVATVRPGDYVEVPS
jgi:hypothetical protein